MLTEIYMQEPSLSLTNTATDTSAATTAATDNVARGNAKLARKLGLTQQAKNDLWEIRKARADAWLKARGLTWLTDEQQHLWGNFLPAGYRSDPKRATDNWEPFSAYSHPDGVPFEVRLLMANTKAVFDRLEIWAYEKQDPALIGVMVGPNETDRVMLARWGKERLINEADVRIVLRSVGKSDGRFAAQFALLMAVFHWAALAISIKWESGVSQPTIWIGLGVIILLGVATVQWRRLWIRWRRPYLAAFIEERAT